MQEYTLKLSTQTAMRVAGLQARIQVADDVMRRIMQSYKELCDLEQQRMDMMMSNICDAQGVTLPTPYQYQFDPIEMTLKIRETETLEPDSLEQAIAREHVSRNGNIHVEEPK